MILFYVAIMILVIWGMRFSKEKPFDNKDGCLSRYSTDSIKGIFILVVFARHIFPYIAGIKEDLGYLDQMYCSIDPLVRQLLVVMFLFYSGYGVTESIAAKGKTYIDAIPQKRILTTFLNFSVAVCIFIGLASALGKDLTIEQCLLSLIGWESVGNSNWYIFCILICYAATYIAFKASTNNRGALILLSLLSIAYLLVVQYFRGGYWVDTVFAYTAGVAFSLYKDKITTLLEHKYWLCLSAFFSLFMFFYLIPYRHLYIADNICAIFFALTLLCITMRARIQNRHLCWLGKNLFPLYIYQRIPMIALLAIEDGILAREHEWLYVIASLAITIGIAYLYRYIAITDKYLAPTFYLKTIK